jgi:hypothetical protein
VISNFFYRFSGRINEEKLYEKKKFRRSAVCRLSRFHGCPYEKFVRTIFERCFQVRDFSFWITEGIGPTGVSFYF